MEGVTLPVPQPQNMHQSQLESNIFLQSLLRLKEPVLLAGTHTHTHTLELSQELNVTPSQPGAGDYLHDFYFLLASRITALLSCLFAALPLFSAFVSLPSVLF